MRDGAGDGGVSDAFLRSQNGYATPVLPFDNDDMARIIRHHLEARRLRTDFLPEEMFGEPAWDMLLDLFVADCEGKRISISSACIASGGPATTALRWLSRLAAADFVERTSDARDRRRIFVQITPRARDAIIQWMIRASENA